MSCNYKLNFPLFKIVEISFEDKEKKIYYFVGLTHNKDISDILKKIENKKIITKKELELLKKAYPNNYKNIASLLKTEKNASFIFDKITMNNTINDIKNKITSHFSDEKNSNYILKNDQLLWISTKDEKKYILGNYYENIEVDPELVYKEKIKPDKKFISYIGDKKKMRLNSNYNMTLYDLITNNKIKTNQIYLLNAREIYNILVKKKKINNNILKGWFLKYFPKFIPDIKTKGISKIYTNIRDYNNINNYTNYLLNNTINYKSTFSGCKIQNMKVNSNIKLIKEKYQNENLRINLTNIFNYIRYNNILSEKVPFMKYKNPKLKDPIPEAWSGVKDIIDKDKLKQWVGLKKKDRVYTFKQITNNLQIKKLYKKVEDYYIYYTIIIWDNSHINLNISLKESYAGDFTDIVNILNDCKTFINMLNDNVKGLCMTKGVEKFKIITPSIKIKDNKVILDKYTIIDYFNSVTFYENENNIKFKDLKKYVSNFSDFIILKDPNRDLSNSLMVKYKKVSNFANMNLILSSIDEKKKENIPDSLILQEISNEFNIPIQKSIEYLKEWKFKYGISTTKSQINFNNGVSLQFFNNKFFINGIKNIQQLVSITKFSKMFIYTFMFLDEFKKISDFKDQIIDKKFKKPNNNNDLNKELYENYSNDDSDYDEYLKNINESQAELELNNDEIVNFNDKDEENEEIYIDTQKMLASDDEIEPTLTIEVTCTVSKPNEELDTCGDLCEDNKYLLRRLQKYANKLFRYGVDKKNGKFKQYSRACQQKDQPLVLDYDPMKANDIDKESIKGVLKYNIPGERELYYICPDAFCPTCEKVISRQQLKDNNIKIIEKEGVNGKCTVAECPYSKKSDPHLIYVFSEKHKFPGFSTNKHPDGYCLPCCFTKDHSDKGSSRHKAYLECLGTNIDHNNEDDQKTYILGMNVIPVPNNRFGLCYPSISAILGSQCDRGQLDDKRCYVRKGIKQNVNQSFLHCIADLISTNKEKPISIKTLKKSLAKKCTPKIFRSLNNGVLEYRFETLENYKKFLLSEKEKINHEYLWDYLQRPNILYNTGCNIIIFNANSIMCPYKEFIQTFYDIERPTLLIVKSRFWYEPIYYIYQENNDIHQKWIYNTDNKIIMNIMDLLINDCKYYYDIYWRRVLVDNLKKYKINNDERDKPEISLFELENKLKNDTVKIKEQIMYPINKIKAVFLTNGLYVPILARGYVMKYDDIDYDNNSIKFLDYKTTVNLYNKLSSKLGFKVLYKILNHDKKIIGILLNCDRFVPVATSPMIKDNIPIKSISYYGNANRNIYNNVSHINNRISYMSKYNYQTESFERLKFEIANYINVKKNKKYRKDIKSIIKSDDLIKDKRKKVSKILEKLFNLLVVFKSIPFNIDDYIKPNIREVCFKKKSCLNDFHCIKVGEKCKLLINTSDFIKGKNNKKNFLSRLTDFLVTNKDRLQVLNNEMDNIIDETKIDPVKDQILFKYQNAQNLDKLITEYYKEKEDIIIKKDKLLDETESEQLGFNRNKYIKINKTNTDIEEIALPPLWKDYLPNFNIQVRKEIGKLDNSIFGCIKYVLIFINKFDKDFISNMAINISIDNLNISCIKELYMNYLNSLTTEDIKIYEPKHKYKTVGNFIKKEYHSKCPKIFKIYKTYDTILHKIDDQQYMGCYVDIMFFANIFNINFICLYKRRNKKRNGVNFDIVKSNNKSPYYVILITSKDKTQNFYELVTSRIDNIYKYCFLKDEMPIAFKKMIFNMKNSNENSNSNEE